MKQWGSEWSRSLKGGEAIELRGDVGAGKTTLVKGVASGLGVMDEVQSPSFTISRTYEARDDLRLIHYDFYRLTDAGIMANEIAEAMSDPKNIVIIEWADIIEGILPPDHSTITITAPTETTREIVVVGPLAEATT